MYLDTDKKLKLFYYSLHFLVLFINSTVLFGSIYEPAILFQLTFIFIYNTLDNKFLILTK